MLDVRVILLYQNRTGYVTPRVSVCSTECYQARGLPGRGIERKVNRLPLTCRYLVITTPRLLGTSSQSAVVYMDTAQSLQCIWDPLAEDGRRALDCSAGASHSIVWYLG